MIPSAQIVPLVCPLMRGTTGQRSQCLLELGVRRVRLLTNNPKKVSAVEAAAIVVEERVPLVAGATVENKRYLQAKTEKLGHLLAQNIEH